MGKGSRMLRVIRMHIDMMQKGKGEGEGEGEGEGRNGGGGEGVAEAGCDTG